jgi:hypothetical protein
LTKTPPTNYQSVWHMPQVLSLHYHHTENLKSNEHPLRVRNSMATRTNIPYILESNPHFFYSFRGLKNQMQIIITCGLDSLSRAGFWKSVRAAVRAIRAIQYSNLLFYILLIIIYYSSDSPSSLITELLSPFGA